MYSPKMDEGWENKAIFPGFFKHQPYASRTTQPRNYFAEALAEINAIYPPKTKPKTSKLKQKQLRAKYLKTLYMLSLSDSALRLNARYERIMGGRT